jgi:hypothetical protein
VFQFGNQTVRTQVGIMLPAQFDALSVDVADYIWEKEPA